jgi:hypothetical protein
VYSCPPIVIAPVTCVPGNGTRINSAQKPPAETSMVKAAELAPRLPPSNRSYSDGEAVHSILAGCAQ